MLIAALLAMMALISQYKMSQMVTEDAFKAKYEALCQGQNLQSLIGAFWTVLNLLRLILTVGILILLRDYASL